MAFFSRERKERQLDIWGEEAARGLSVVWDGVLVGCKWVVVKIETGVCKWFFPELVIAYDVMRRGA